MVTEKQVLEALSKVKDPELRRDVVELGMIHDVEIEEGRVSFTLALTTMACPFKERMVENARLAVGALPGVNQVEVNLRAMTPEERKKIVGDQTEGVAAALNDVKHIIAVMSGKGGVGKSLVAGLLAVALRREGYEVGVLDADITGPSIPRLFFSDPPQPQGGPMGLVPVDSSTGIRVMSINLLLPREDEAVIWRGPLISRAIQQFWGDVIWGELDALVVDLPPGTSDASLTVMQSIPLDGVVMVTSPQGLAGMVVRKAARMAQQMKVPLLGLVENMSYVTCPGAEEPFELFGPSHAHEIASLVGVPFLGRLPIDPRIATMCDVGQIEDYPAKEFEPIAREVARTIGLTKVPA
ncbi:MAG: Mrp/NBP35 family ATP-binding protein [Chloroflexia bacterium]|nr:Mrp/NBP35 family ATP-binding protein [Chloroflexia bacterium]